MNCSAIRLPLPDTVGHLVSTSLMLQNDRFAVSCLVSKLPFILCDKAAEIAHKAHHERLSLREAALKLGYLTEKEFDEVERPEEMTSPEAVRATS